MNLLKMALLCVLLGSFVSCSKIQQWREGLSEGEGESEIIGDFEEGDPDVEIDGDEFAEDETVDEVVDNAKIASEEYDNIESGMESGPGREVAETSETVLGEPGEQIASDKGTGNREYVVQENDTLMWISFKVYGDYLRWRELLNANPGIDPESLSAGMRIQYPMPDEEFNWNPEGRPYLIIRGDTLGIISDKVYGTMKKWRSIWNNNRRMIKNPDLIFAGFTIYYLEEGSLALNDQ